MLRLAFVCNHTCEYIYEQFFLTNLSADEFQIFPNEFSDENACT